MRATLHSSLTTGLMRQTRTSTRRCHRSCLAMTCHCRTTSSWHRRGAAATSHAPHGPSESGCRRDAHDEAHMAQATSTKWAIMRLGLACAPGNLSRSSQPDPGIILSARREPGAHSDSELGPRWGRDSEPAAPLVDVTRRPSDSRTRIKVRLGVHGPSTPRRRPWASKFRLSTLGSECCESLPSATPLARRHPSHRHDAAGPGPGPAGP